MTRPALRKTRNSIRQNREVEEASVNPVEVDRIEGIYKGLVGGGLHLIVFFSTGITETCTH